MSQKCFNGSLFSASITRSSSTEMINSGHVFILFAIGNGANAHLIHNIFGRGVANGRGGAVGTCPPGVTKNVYFMQVLTKNL